MDINGVDLKILKSSLSGNNFKILLKQKKVNKYKISKDLDISWQTLRNWEKGMVKPSDENAFLVGRYLGLVEADKEELYKLKVQAKEILETIERMTGNKKNSKGELNEK